MVLKVYLKKEKGCTSEIVYRCPEKRLASKLDLIEQAKESVQNFLSESFHEDLINGEEVLIGSIGEGGKFKPERHQ